MSIKLEITADTVAELFADVQGLAALLTGSTEAPDEQETAQPPEPKAAPKRSCAAKAEPEAEAVEPSPPETPASTAPTAESAEPEAVETAEPEAVEQEIIPATPAKTLDFDRDVAPHVLNCVKEKGKPRVIEILSQFGAEQASKLDPALWPELVNVLKDELAS